MPDPQERPPQHQDRQPGHQDEMRPPPIDDDPAYRPSGKLAGKVALITGGDSGMGRGYPASSRLSSSSRST